MPNCELARLVARCRREHLSYADVLLVAADGSVHECHKVVLAAQSPVFDRMFQAEMQEAATGRVVMDDVSPDALDALLHYLYGGCTLQPSITVELFTGVRCMCVCAVTSSQLSPVQLGAAAAAACMPSI